MTQEQQPAALRLANDLDSTSPQCETWQISAELRRLHAENEEMRAERIIRMTQNDRMAQRIAELEAQQKSRDCERPECMSHGCVSPCMKVCR